MSLFNISIFENDVCLVEEEQASLNTVWNMLNIHIGQKSFTPISVIYSNLKTFGAAVGIEPGFEYSIKEIESSNDS